MFKKSFMKQNKKYLGLNFKTLKKISLLRKEPKFICDFRVKSWKFLETQKPPTWLNLTNIYNKWQNYAMYSSVTEKDSSTTKELLKKLSSVDSKVLRSFKKLNLPLNTKKISIDIVIDSKSMFVTQQKSLKEQGVIFCSIRTAIQNPKYRKIIKKWLGSVVSYDDNYYAAINSAWFSDGSFCYIPKGVHC